MPITFEFWTKTMDNTTGIYDKRGANGSNYIEIRVIGGRYGFNYSSPSGGGIDLTSTNTINDGQWHHCAVTVNTTEAKMYVDGVLDKTVSWTGTAGHSGLALHYPASRHGELAEHALSVKAVCFAHQCHRR